jgi:hypothetical protein
MRQNYLRNQILNTLKGNSDEITEGISLSKLLVALANVRNKNHFGKALCGLYPIASIYRTSKKEISGVQKLIALYQNLIPFERKR